MWFQNVIYVIWKMQNRRLILDENLSCLGMFEPRISCIQQCKCGSNIYNIKEDMVQKVRSGQLVEVEFPVLSLWATMSGVASMIPLFMMQYQLGECS